MTIETCPKCGGDLMSYVLTTYPPIAGKKCLSCDWRWQDKFEEIKRVPFKPKETKNAGIIVPGMGIPEECGKCPFHRWSDDGEYTYCWVSHRLTRWWMQERDASCPLRKMENDE